jgi:hypothetical protein
MSNQQTGLRKAKDRLDYPPDLMGVANQLFEDTLAPRGITYDATTAL